MSFWKILQTGPNSEYQSDQKVDHVSWKSVQIQGSSLDMSMYIWVSLSQLFYQKDLLSGIYIFTGTCMVMNLYPFQSQLW